jgi:hypothetical protein
MESKAGFGKIAQPPKASFGLHEEGVTPAYLNGMTSFGTTGLEGEKTKDRSF